MHIVIKTFKTALFLLLMAMALGALSVGTMLAMG